MTKDKSCDSQYVASDELHNVCVPQSVNIEYTCILDFYSPVAQGFKRLQRVSVLPTCVFICMCIQWHIIFTVSPGITNT